MPVYSLFKPRPIKACGQVWNHAMNALSGSAPSKRAPFIILILAALFVGSVGNGIYGTIFNNYLADVQQMPASGRGILELPRELPGVLSMFAVGMLFFLNEVRIATVAMLLCCIGTAALALPSISTGFWPLAIWIMVASLGQHILMVIADAIVIHTALPENRGLRLGQMRALGTAAGLLAAFLVWIKWKFNSSYAVDFVFVTILCLVAGAMLMFVKTDKFPDRGGWKDSFFLKRKYAKYYLLETLFGARKQVFITFGSWLMVSTLKLSPSYMGMTLLVAGVLGLAFQPFIGKMIQRFGEGRVLSVDCGILFFVCMTYAFALDLFSPAVALGAITVCFILDSLLFADGAARAHYLGRICERKEEITPSLYTGMAINHVVSIVCAVFGGLLWTWSGSHRLVFVFSAILAILSGIVSETIKKAPQEK